MRIVAILALAVMALSFARAERVLSQTTDQIFIANLRGYDEVPSLSTNGRGRLRLVVKMTTMDFQLTYADLDTPSAAHIHFGQPGVNGGIIAFLCGGGYGSPCPPPGVAVTGSIDAADIVGPAGQGIAAGEFAEARRAVLKGFVYANAHTGAYPGGEIRGQLVKQP